MLQMVAIFSFCMQPQIDIFCHLFNSASLVLCLQVRDSGQKRGSSDLHDVLQGMLLPKLISHLVRTPDRLHE
jgi:hypothetical protein